MIFFFGRFSLVQWSSQISKNDLLLPYNLRPHDYQLQIANLCPIFFYLLSPSFYICPSPFTNSLSLSLSVSHYESLRSLNLVSLPSSPSLSLSLDLPLSLCISLSILCSLSLMFFSDQHLCYVDILHPLQVFLLKKARGQQYLMIMMIKYIATPTFSMEVLMNSKCELKQSCLEQHYFEH